MSETAAIKQMVTGRWTSTDDQELIRVIRTARSWDEVAARLGRTPKAVVRRANRLRKRGELSGWPNITKRTGKLQTPDYRPWTPLEVARVRSLAGDGKAQREVAAIMGRSKMAIQTLAHRRGITFGLARKTDVGILGKRPNAWGEQDVRYIHERRLAGDNVDAIARELGRTPQSVSQLCQRLGIAPKRFHWAEADEARLRMMMNMGLSDAMIGKRLGVSGQVVINKRLSLGIRRRPAQGDQKAVAA